MIRTIYCADCESISSRIELQWLDYNFFYAIINTDISIDKMSTSPYPSNKVKIYFLQVSMILLNLIINEY